MNFGDVGQSTFAAGSTKSSRPGNTVSYAHTFTAQTGGSVSFGIASAVETPALTGWGQKIYADASCTGSLQPGAALLYPPAVATTVTVGQQVCVIMQEFIPANALKGYIDTVTVQADFTFADANLALVASYPLTDVTKAGSGALDLKKEVRNVTQGILIFGVNNQAKTGETLEYRLTYTNNGASPITNLSVSDVTPNYTTLISALDGTTPAGLTACLKNTPANPAPTNAAVACSAVQAVGSTGPVAYNFTGFLSPLDTGTVLFRVKVDQRVRVSGLAGWQVSRLKGSESYLIHLHLPQRFGLWPPLAQEDSSKLSTDIRNGHGKQKSHCFTVAFFILTFDALRSV